MTEQSVRNLPGFSGPIYDESDGRCDGLTRPNSPGFDTIAEAEDEGEALTLLKDSGYLVKGAIRYAPDDVRVIFWKYRR
jgi:hypothetical protein